MSAEDKTAIETAADKTISWMESNRDASVDELKQQKKALEEIAQPIISKLYQGAGGSPPPGGEAPPTSDDAKDEL